MAPSSPRMPASRHRYARFAWVLVLALLVAALAPLAPAGATTNAWPHTAVGGFATPDGRGFWVVYANGAVVPAGSARFYGDSSHRALRVPIMGGASTATGHGYWLVTANGGVLYYGDAHNYGSHTGHLNAPITSIAATKSGHGYWLVARDGGVFAFGDAPFRGSVGAKNLSQPITSITANAPAGYRVVGADGGVFAFGGAHFYGTLISRGIRSTSVVGLAPTSTGHGYWIVMRGGQVSPYGDAKSFGNYTLPTCDQISGVIANPHAAGYRLVTYNGATIPYGAAPGGTNITGTELWCHAQTTCEPALRTAADYQAALHTRGPVWDGADGGTTVDLGDGRRLWLFGDTFSGPTDAVHVLPGWGFLRNSMAVEHGNCFTFRLGGGLLARGDYFPRLGGGASTGWFWPVTGVADPAAGVVYVSAMHIVSVPGHPNRWRVGGYTVFVLDLKSLAPRSMHSMPTPGGHLWGTTMVESGGMVYLYANDSGHLYVARTTPAHLLAGPWQFSTGAGWSPSVAAAKQVVFKAADGSADVGPGNGLTVSNYGAGYLMGGTRCDILCNDVTAWYAPTPAGPFQAVSAPDGRIRTETSYPDQEVYGGHLLHLNSLWLTAWSTNGPRTAVPFLKYYYGVRVAPPQNLAAASVLAAHVAH